MSLQERMKRSNDRKNWSPEERQTAALEHIGDQLDLMREYSFDIRNHLQRIADALSRGTLGR